MDSSPGPPHRAVTRADAPALPGVGEVDGGPSAGPDETALVPNDLAEASERLQAEEDLRACLAARGFAGPAYAVLEDELAAYGYELMMAWLSSGYIFQRCREAGLRLAAGPIPAGDREDLAQETVAAALRAFRVRRARGWRPDLGASLKTYFTGSLFLEFANIWKRRCRDQKATGPVLPLDELLYDVRSPAPGPEDLAVQRDEVLRGLDRIRSFRTRVTLALTEDGYEQDEIAEILGPGVTTRAVEGYLRRHRRAMAARKEGRHE